MQLMHSLTNCKKYHFIVVLPVFLPMGLFCIFAAELFITAWKKAKKSDWAGEGGTGAALY
ncbi:hypothetical protein VV869_21525 [Photobacterium sp. MCCC 1A19761]|uniref:hypothetical protein n=1 Tax=Photobacterium sp. MCCC 1A19761 TaxID=3115000 RepID=UPI00307F951E